MATCMTLTKLGLLPPQRRRFNFVHSSNFSPLGNCVIFMAFSPFANLNSLDYLVSCAAEVGKAILVSHLLLPWIMGWWLLPNVGDRFGLLA